MHGRKRIEAVEMNSLMNICGERRIDRVRNEEIRQRCRKKFSVSESMDQSILRWFGQMKRMEDDRLARCKDLDVVESHVRDGWML